MNYRSVSQLNQDVIRWMHDLPSPLDVIVGIPRSGLLVANLLSLYLNLPLTDVDGLLNGRLIKGGVRDASSGSNNNVLKNARNILVVDDSIASGSQIKMVKEKLTGLKSSVQILYAAVYAPLGEEKYLVDYFYEELPRPRIFEWNIMHHRFLTTFCVTLEGVICRNPTIQEQKDKAQYRNYIQNVKPTLIPTQSIGYLVTFRPEKYRSLTEKWLSKNQIHYENLVIIDTPFPQVSASEIERVAEVKGHFYKRTDSQLFIEGISSQAEEIAHISDKSVLCRTTGQMIQPT